MKEFEYIAWWFFKLVLSNSRTEKRRLKNFKEFLIDCFWHVSASSGIKSQVDNQTTKTCPQEQRMMINTYCLLAAAVYFLTHMQRSLAASMEQARLISIPRFFFGRLMFFFIWSRIELLDLERCPFQRRSDKPKGHIPFYFVPMLGWHHRVSRFYGTILNAWNFL